MEDEQPIKLCKGEKKTVELTHNERRCIEKSMLGEIRSNPSGIDTRILISNVHAKVIPHIPHSNRHHIAGMIAWVIASTNFCLIIRTPGKSVIA